MDLLATAQSILAAAGIQANLNDFLILFGLLNCLPKVLDYLVHWS